MTDFLTQYFVWIHEDKDYVNNLISKPVNLSVARFRGARTFRNTYINGVNLQNRYNRFMFGSICGQPINVSRFLSMKIIHGLL